MTTRISRSTGQLSKLPRLQLLGLAVLCLAAALAALPVARAQGGSFQVNCTFSHRNHDDPIVFAGAPGTSHLHDFFGAVTTAANSTYATMTASRSSCSDRQDTAGYWHPHLTVGGRSLTAQTTAWYSLGGKSTAMSFPRGIKLLAGNSMAMTPQSRRVVWWHCSGTGGARAAPPHGRPLP